ncbi:MAG: oligosaccharide flippase family protein [Magnetococcales bacterium]|nr:oligosaccharide flippase family protein [Magnetococcales bacterium]
MAKPERPVRSNPSALLKPIAIYGVSLALTKAVGFLLLPFYTRFLSPTDFGVLALLDMVGTYFGIVVEAGFVYTFTKFYHEQSDERWRKRVFSTSLWTTLLIGAGCFIVVTPLAHRIIDMLFVEDANPDYIFYLVMILGTVWIDVLNVLGLTLFRLREEPISYLKVTAGRTIIAVGLNVYFIGVMKIGILGFLIANLITATLMALLLGLLLLRRHWQRPDRALAWQMVKFSLPFIPTGFVEAFINAMGVVALSMMGHLEAAGVYAIGWKIGGVIMLLSVPVNNWWNPRMFKIAGTPEAPEIYAKGLSYFFLFMCSGALALGILAEEIITLMTTPKFHGAIHTIFPLALGLAFFLLRSDLRIGLALAKRTWLFPLLTGTPILLGFPLAMRLGESHGPEGAAWGVMTAMMLAPILTGLASRRYLKVPYQLFRLLRILMAIGICMAAARLHPEIGLMGRLALLMMGYPLLLLLLRVITWGMVREAWGWLQQSLKRRLSPSEA